MADLTITAADVSKGADAVTTEGTAAVAITAGQVVYESSTGNYSLAVNTSTAAAAASGIALNTAASGHPVVVLERGNLDPGATVTVGTPYCVSDTAGGLAPWSDLSSNDFVTIVGVGTTNSNIKVQVLASGNRIA